MDASERDVLMAAAIGARAEATADLENRTMGKVTWRLVPLLTVCFFIAFLDRVNVGFANASFHGYMIALDKTDELSGARRSYDCFQQSHGLERLVSRTTKGGISQNRRNKISINRLGASR